MPTTRRKVLVVDDDLSHLEIYGLLLKQAGYEPVSALVRFNGTKFPTEPNIDGIILDYKLNSLDSSTYLARQIRRCYPVAPIILLSDTWHLPTDIAPYVADFVRRGEPGMLLDKLHYWVPKSGHPIREPALPAFPCTSLFAAS